MRPRGRRRLLGWQAAGLWVVCISSCCWSRINALGVEGCYDNGGCRKLVEEVGPGGELVSPTPTPTIAPTVSNPSGNTQIVANTQPPQQQPQQVVSTVTTTTTTVITTTTTTSAGGGGVTQNRGGGVNGQQLPAPEGAWLKINGERVHVVDDDVIYVNGSWVLVNGSSPTVPTPSPSIAPTAMPTLPQPTEMPTMAPTAMPTLPQPTAMPTFPVPTMRPTINRMQAYEDWMATVRLADYIARTSQTPGYGGTAPGNLGGAAGIPFVPGVGGMSGGGGGGFGGLPTGLSSSMSGCMDSIGGNSDSIFNTWNQGVSQSTGGLLASQAVQASVNSMALPADQASQMKAAYALYDTWRKTGSPSRRHRRKLQTSSDGNLGAMYYNLSPSVTPKCKSTFKDWTTLNQPTVAPTVAPGGGSPAPTSAPNVDPGNTERCNTYAKGALSLQLCQSVSTSSTSSSAQLSGSVINTGISAACGLSLIIDNFQLASSYYPSWLPSYEGTFQPGDVITFGVTLPYTQGGSIPKVDLAQTVRVCGAPTPAPTIQQGGSGPISTPTPAPANQPYMTSNEGMDWSNVGGVDTSCLASCMFMIKDMTVCDAYDAIFTFRCDLCDTDTLNKVRDTCSVASCGNQKCHVETSTFKSGGHSVKDNVSMTLGFVAVFLVIALLA